MLLFNLNYFCMMLYVLVCSYVMALLLHSLFFTMWIAIMGLFMLLLRLELDWFFFFKSLSLSLLFWCKSIVTWFSYDGGSFPCCYLIGQFEDLSTAICLKLWQLLASAKGPPCLHPFLLSYLFTGSHPFTHQKLSLLVRFHWREHHIKWPILQRRTYTHL